MKNRVTLYILCILLTGCFPEAKYKITDNAVYMTGWSEANGDYIIPVKDADQATFELIENDNHLLIGKDKNHVFFETTLIENADPNTFRPIGNYYFVDNDSVYFFGFYNNKNDCEVWGVRPSEIKLYEKYPWAHDNGNVVFGQTVTQLSNPNDLQIVNKNWGRTTDKVFYKGYLVDSVDIPTFKILSDEKAEDKNYIYYQGAVYLRRNV